ncbi:methyl-accepting chemotaxis protein [Natronobacterium texcoconense]|nr:methyl-accepting chemotaxis protein [Natronobacterium texcoconense]
MSLVRQLIPAVIRRRYAVKFAIALLVLGVTVGMIGFVATATITDEVEERVQDDHSTAVQQEAQSLQMWHDQNERTASLIATSDVVARDDAAAIENSLSDWRLEHRTEVFEISYVDTDEEEVLASTADRFRGESIDALESVDDDAIDALEEDGEWVSDPTLVDDHGGDETPVVSYVVASDDDRAIVYSAELVSYMHSVHVDDHVTMMALDGDGTVMADSEYLGDEYETFGLEYDDEATLAMADTDEADTDVIEGAPSGVLGHDAYGFDSDEYIVSITSVSGTDWSIVYHEPTEEAYGFVHSVNEWGMIATAVSVLTIGLIGAVLGRNTSRSIDKLTRKAERMEGGDLAVELETKRIDNIGRLYKGFDSMRDALREQIEEAEAAREEAEQERERVEEINAHLEHKADEYSEVMEEAAAGDLTARMDGDGENEAMTEIAEDFNEMLAEIEATVADLNRFATEVATASEEVTASSEEVRSASQQVTESIQQISDGADRQNESLQSVNGEMTALSTTTEEIAASSNEVADIAERTVETGRHGQEAAQEAIAAMGEIEADAEDTIEEIRRLESEVQQIDELIVSISEIAHQTNMLALNANIEASRSANAGDGEGFAAVAQEVKTLSEDVADAADEAENRLEAIRERTDRSVDEVESTSTNIDDASRKVSDAVDALEEIAELARQTNVGVQEISAATEEQAASTQEVVAMVDEAATISDSTSAEAETVTAAAEEQTSALTEVTESASQLSGQASRLSEALDRFETDPDDLEDSVFDSDAVEVVETVGDGTDSAADTGHTGTSPDEHSGDAGLFSDESPDDAESLSDEQPDGDDDVFTFDSDDGE